MTATAESRPAGDAHGTRSRATSASLSLPLFGLLAIEFILGMMLALLVSLPSGKGIVTILTSSAVLDVHVVIAFLIIGTSARALVVSLRESVPLAMYGSVIALLSALVATGAGWDFSFYGQNAGASFVMSMGFLGVLVGAFLLRAPVGSRSAATGPTRSASPADGEVTP
jgi:hypothetical protein